MDKSEKTIIFIVIGVVVSCLFISALCATIFFISDKLVASTTPIIPEVPTAAMPTVTVCSVGVRASTLSAEVDQNLLQIAMQTQAELEKAVLPTTDLNKIEEHLSGRVNIPIQLTTPPVQYQIGDQSFFYKLDADNNEVRTAATLRYATDKVYFWAENDIVLNQEDLKILVDTFTNHIYPTDHGLFGSEWIPGVDNDPHLFILYARGLGESLAGYTSSIDYVLPEVNKYSNAHEMFVINADEQDITDPYTLSTMAHEYQHVILGYRDPDEDLWLNEGFSELATLINGYDAGGFDYYFTQKPDFQLTDWSPDYNLNDYNYGASYMFATYFYGRFGEDTTRELVSNPLNGLSSLDDIFQSAQVVDPLTETILTADSFFQDWTITNFLNNQSVEGGRYFYSQYLDVPLVSRTNWLNECQGTVISESVHQYGTDYFQIACDQLTKLIFSGNPTINILPDLGANQSFFMWSNRGDSADTSITREFDLTSYSDEINLSFDAWFDLEEDFDFAYVMASEDGEKWSVLSTDNCSANANGSSIGCALTASSEGWVTRNVDLSIFAGKRIWLRFEMISDGGVSNNGFAIDNVKIPATDYEESFETNDGGWYSAGFSRIQNTTPQSYLVSIITSDPNLSVKKYSVAPGEELELLIDPNCLEDFPILVVSGSSRLTRQEAQYTISISE